MKFDYRLIEQNIVNDSIELFRKTRYINIGLINKDKVLKIIQGKIARLLDDYINVIKYENYDIFFNEIKMVASRGMYYFPLYDFYIQMEELSRFVEMTNETDAKYTDKLTNIIYNKLVRYKRKLFIYDNIDKLYINRDLIKIIIEYDEYYKMVYTTRQRLYI